MKELMQNEISVVNGGRLASSGGPMPRIYLPWMAYTPASVHPFLMDLHTIRTSISVSLSSLQDKISSTNFSGEMPSLMKEFPGVE